MKLNVKAFAITLGIIWGLAVLLLTWWLIAFGGTGETSERLGRVYFGYTFTWGGAVIGMLWGFVDGLIVGAIFAWLYNKLSKAPAEST